MQARTTELREMVGQLADKLAGTEHEDIAVRAAALAGDIATDIALVCATLERIVMPTLGQGPPVAPAPPSAG